MMKSCIALLGQVTGRNGKLSSGALKDPKGLSLERGYYRDDATVLSAMAQRLRGITAKFSVKVCRDVNAEIIYMPTINNDYHTELHGSKEQVVLSDSQRHHIAMRAIRVGTLEN